MSKKETAKRALQKRFGEERVEEMKEELVAELLEVSLRLIEDAPSKPTDRQAQLALADELMTYALR